MGKRSLFPKLVIRFLIVILPFCALSLLMNGSSQTNIKEQLFQSMDARSRYYLDTIEAEFLQIVKLQREYLSDTDLHRLSELSDTMTDYERTSAILRIQEKLNLIQNSSKYTKSVEVFIPSIGKLIGSNVFMDEVPEQRIDLLRTTTSTVGTQLFRLKDKVFIGIPYQIRTDASGNPIYFWGIEVNVERIQSDLKKFAENNNGGALLVSVKDDWSITDSGKNNSIHMNMIRYLQNHPPNKGNIGQSTTVIDNKSYFISYIKSDILDMVFVVYVPEQEILGPLQKYRIWFWLVSIVTVIVVIIYSYWLYRLIHQPMNILTRAFRKVESGNLNVSVHQGDKGEFEYLFDQFNVMVSKLKVLIQEVYEQKTRLQRSELKQLQSQINPHFLYNSFFILYRMAKKHDVDKLELFTRHLGDYFQFITRNHSDEVTLESEIHHARVYTEIQAVRFQNRISIYFEQLPKEYNELSVPRLIVQPLIENAVQHGMENKLEGGIINVTFSADNDRIMIIVEDNGDGLTKEELKRLQIAMTEESLETTGMLNVHRRLQIKYGQNGGITVSESMLGGLCVQLSLPLSLNQNKDNG